MIRFASPQTQETLGLLLAGRVALSEDTTFISPTSPRSALYAAPSIASTGTTLAAIDADLKSAIDAITTAGHNLLSAIWVLSPKTATTLSMMRTSGGDRAFPELAVNGGELCGLPAIVSFAVNGVIALIDQASVVIEDDPQVEIDMSEQGTIEMNSAPTESSLTPTASTVVSLYQTNTVAIRAVIQTGWYIEPGRNVYISGVTY